MVEEINTELIWSGKYDKLVRGKKIPVERIPLPFQIVETVNEPRDKQKSLGAFSKKEDNGWKNKLIWGDNKFILSSLLNGDNSIGLEPLRGKIKLIYIDPPFFTGSNMPIQIPVGEGEENIVKEPSVIEDIAYRNIWKYGIDSFCQWIYERLVLMRDLLAEDGSIYVRFDYHYSHYVKLILDEIFGKENFQNELIVNRIKKSDTGAKKFNTATDSLFFYTKSLDYTFNGYRKRMDIIKQERWHSMDSQGQGPPRTIFGKLMHPPGGRHWTFNQDKIDQMIKEGKIRLNPKSGKPEYKLEATDTQLIDSNWTDIPGYSFATGYPTENSEVLLERVITSSSNERDLVADFFGGSGTTAIVAEKLGRTWITADIGKFSIHTIRKRLLDLSVEKDKVVCNPFEILNLGKYERQQWQLKTLGEDVLNYIRFIVELYHAQNLEGFKFLHGKVGNKVVHVGQIDAPVNLREIKDVLEECKANKIKSVDILGWEFENGLNNLIQEEAKNDGIILGLKIIPREVMDKRAVESGDVHFYELASLDVEVKQNKNEVQIILKDFIIPNPELIPEDARDKIKKWSDYIDYWSIDWDFKNDTFHNQWQDFRTRKNTNLKTTSEKHTYSNKGKYKILVKVVDIFGNDTTKLLEVSIK